MIVTTGAVASLAAKNATTIIPIVSLTGDPVLIGLVASMSRPGGNITDMLAIVWGMLDNDRLPVDSLSAQIRPPACSR